MRALCCSKSFMARIHHVRSSVRLYAVPHSALFLCPPSRKRLAHIVISKILHRKTLVISFSVGEKLGNEGEVGVDFLCTHFLEEVQPFASKTVSQPLPPA